MKRVDVLESIYDDLKDKLVVTNMGAVAVELYNLGHQRGFFYLEHSMGLASSVGLGLALCLPDKKIVVLDGDASVLMNLGTLSTMARYSPSNLIHVIFDNESLLSVGGFPSATSTGTDLSAVAQGSGVKNTGLYTDIEVFHEAYREAAGRDELSVLVAKVEAVGPTSFAMDIGLLENRFDFARHIKELRSE
jgi:sulfopyruvate decarboxylase subunit beta